MEHKVLRPSVDVGASASDGDVPVHSRRRQAWVVIGVVLVVGGIAGAWLAARSVAGHAAQTSQQTFSASSHDIATTLQLALQHEDDLVVTARAFVSSDPGASNRQFLQWMAA